jgi:hypothetical protein
MKGALKVRNIEPGILLFQSFTVIAFLNQGRRASRCSALAPGYYISRLWRCSTLDLVPKRTVATVLDSV